LGASIGGADGAGSGASMDLVELKLNFLKIYHSALVFEKLIMIILWIGGILYKKGLDAQNKLIFLLKIIFEQIYNY